MLTEWVCKIGVMVLNDRHSRGSLTFRLGVNGSGSLMLRGKALRMRLRSWMQLGGMTSQKP